MLSTHKQIRQVTTGEAAIDLVAVNLRRIRCDQGLTQEALADRAQVARHLITKIETRVHENPTLESLDRLAKALGVLTEAFFTDPN
jgi:transcriptional regulator with XRE-family HTH domain